MDFEAVANAIRSRFKTEIEDGLSLPVQYDNQSNFDKGNASIWIRFSVRFSDNRQVTLGNGKRFRARGLAFAQVFEKVGDGDGESFGVVDSIVAAFRSLAIGGVVYQTPIVNQIGRDGDEWLTNVNCPFYADDIES